MRVHQARAVGGQEAAVSCVVAVSPKLAAGVSVSRTSPSAAFVKGRAPQYTHNRWPDPSRHDASQPPLDCLSLPGNPL